MLCVEHGYSEGVATLNPTLRFTPVWHRSDMATRGEYIVCAFSSLRVIGNLEKKYQVSGPHIKRRTRIVGIPLWLYHNSDPTPPPQSMHTSCIHSGNVWKMTPLIHFLPIA